MCPRVKEIWSHLGLVELISHMCERDDQGSSVLESLLRNRSAKAPRLPEVDRNDLIATAVWYIWWERRKATHGEPVQTPARSAQAISNLALSYYRAKKKKSGIVRHGWKKPKEEFVKLNVDAGFDLDSGTGSTGSIIRDDRGYFIAASSRGIPFVSDASTAEAYALRDGLILAGQMGCNRIEVNSDCMEVIEVMQNGGSSLGPAAAIYEECSFLCRNFVEVCFYHCPREANEAADTLARRAEGSMSIVWQDDPPDFLFSVLATDVTIMPNE
jgi:ribonuclease HI